MYRNSFECDQDCILHWDDDDIMETIGTTGGWGDDADDIGDDGDDTGDDEHDNGDDVRDNASDEISWDFTK